MGLYRDESGMVFEADSRYGDAMGYTPVAPAEANDIYAQRGLNDRAASDQENEGTIGAINAGLTGLESGLTAGGSDVLLGKTLPEEYRKRLAGDVAAHPYIRTGTEIAGMVGPSLFGDVSTPTGYLSKVAGDAAEEGLAQGGIRGVSKALGAMGVEGALQSGGQYVGHSAIEDADITAEGLGGALGTGFAFGSLGGGAALGVTKGAMAARKLFARTSDLEGATSAWTAAHQAALEADTTTANTARARLDEINSAKQEALRYRNETKAAARSEQLRAQDFPDAKPNMGTAVPDLGSEGPTPLDAGIAPATSGGQTSVFSRPVEAPPAADVAAASEAATGPTTKVIPRGAAPAADLESQLAGTKARLDSGESIADIGASADRPVIKANKGNASDSIEKWLAEARDYSDVNRSMDNAGLEELGMRRSANKTLSEMRNARTAELLSKPIADTESALHDALDEFEAARKGFLDLTTKDLVPPPAAPGTSAVPTDFLQSTQPKSMAEGDFAKVREDIGTSVGKRKAIAAVDAAHEEALMHAQSANDPAVAGQALQEADQLERMLAHLTAPDPAGVPRDFLVDVNDEAKVISRYEKASAKLTDAVGDGAHPVSQENAKAHAAASDDAVRKASERTTRALEDNETFGPTNVSTKERVAYAKGRANDAAAQYDRATADAIEAKAASKKADAQVKAGEKAKAAATKADARVAKATKAGGGVATALGLDEVLDIKGMPKLSDLPVVGPLLGLYLKARLLGKALGVTGGSMGKIAATADNRVAALAARTQDRVMRAVDRSVGALAAGGKYSVRYVPPVAGVLAARIYDNGQPSPPKSAPIGEQAAARIKELSDYVNTPGAIEKDVRAQLSDVVDPDVIAAAEKQRRAAMQYLLDNAPKMPEQGIIQTIKARPSAAESMSLARRMDAVNDPAGVYERLAAKNAMLSLEAADALQNVYPKLFQLAQQRVVQKIGEENGTIPYRTRVQMTLLYKLPFDAALSPDNMQISQSVYTRKPMLPPDPSAGAPGATAPLPPTPSIAGAGTNLTALFETTADRRSSR